MQVIVKIEDLPLPCPLVHKDQGAGDMISHTLPTLYRVDKAWSRELGGTGLCLLI